VAVHRSRPEYVVKRLKTFHRYTKTPFYAPKTRDVKNTGTPLYVCLINYLKEVNMLTMKQILNALSSNSKAYWVSRGNKDDGYENDVIENVVEGDIVWFSNESTEDDIKEVQSVLAQRQFHLYSKSLATEGKLIKSKSGAFSFIVLPNQG